ncbi:MAG: hypothetical protein ACI9HK_003137 [Pirellulaceae bacterium]|jgi:hypothetical protein
MRFNTVRAKIFFGMGSVILLFIVASMVIVSQVVNTFGHEEVARNLVAAEESFASYIRIRRRLLQDKGRSLAAAPYLKATLTIEELDRNTVFSSAKHLHDVSQTGLLILLDHEGHLLADATDETQFDTSMADFPGVQTAILGSETSRVWKYREKVYITTLSPIIAGDSILGTLVLGLEVNSALAAEIRIATARDVLILNSETLMAEAWQQTPQDSIGGADIETIRAAFPIAAQAAESNIKKVEIRTLLGELHHIFA